MMSPEMREAVVQVIRREIAVNQQGAERLADAILSLLATLGVGEGGSVRSALQEPPHAE